MPRKTPAKPRTPAARSRVAVVAAGPDLMHDLDPDWMQRFRAVALAMPEATEKPHWARPSFAVRGRIFAVLWPDDGKAVLKFTPEQQAQFANARPETFEAVPGGWGTKGYALVKLRGKGAAGAKELKRVVGLAWANAAPKSLLPREVRALKAATPALQRTRRRSGRA